MKCKYQYPCMMWENAFVSCVYIYFLCVICFFFWPRLENEKRTHSCSSTVTQNLMELRQINKEYANINKKQRSKTPTSLTVSIYVYTFVTFCLHEFFWFVSHSTHRSNREQWERKYRHLLVLVRPDMDVTIFTIEEGYS